ncbi:MAG: agmatine deiminase family protein [Actinomycetota bacterium]
MGLTRRTVLKAGAALPVGLWLGGCAEDQARDTGGQPPRSDTSGDDVVTGSARWPEDTAADLLWMPAEEEPHAATWMCFPGRTDVWGVDLPNVQATIADIGLAVARFEPVRMLVRPDDLALAADLVGTDVELIEAPVDDLWARDTLPLFLISAAGEPAAARVRFNGWGDKQVHDGDETLAALVADIVGVDLIDSGLVGEGGGVETDGNGTLLAARSSWVNDNRNPGLGGDEIGAALADALGAERLLWVDGVAGEDITDGHIDTLARFADATTIVHEHPSYAEPGETWYDLAQDTATSLETFATLDGAPYELVALQQPTTTRRQDAEFLASYVNYYVCNSAVLIPEFGDAAADGLAADLIGELYPDREVVVLDIDPVSAGGGGIHCATQQQPSV